MGTRAADARKTMRKLEQAGWKAKQTRSGWVMRHPDGVRTLSIHRSGGSDVRGPRNLQRELGRKRGKEK